MSQDVIRTSIRALGYSVAYGPIDARAGGIVRIRSMKSGVFSYLWALCPKMGI